MPAESATPEDRDDVADAIRRYLAAQPEATDADVAVFVQREGFLTSPEFIQQMRWEMARERGSGDPH